MDDMLRKVLEDEVKREFPGFIQMLERNMDFKRWGFQQTFLGVTRQFPPSVIYDSSHCRVRFLWSEPDVRDAPTIYIRYGRLHAPTDQRYILWSGQQCYCWHDPRMAFQFLDGSSPQDAVYNRFKWPRNLERTHQSITGKGLSQPERQSKMHSASWDYYGERLFSLYDFPHPELWDKYTQFMKNCYEIKQFSDDHGYLEGHKIC